MPAQFRNARLVAGVLFLAVLIAYGNSWNSAFQFDDYNVIVNYDAVHSWAAWYADLGHGLRPLLKLSYMLNWLSGADVFGFHLFNICVHVGVALLVYFITLGLFAPLRNDAPDYRHAAALLAALLFAVHPVNTEAITYISGRSMSLMTLFYLASLLAYIKGSEQREAVWLYVASPVLFILAVASKETAITLPFALLLWDACFSQASLINNITRKQVVHWGIFLLLALLFLFNDRYWQMMSFSAGLNSVQENFLTQLHALTYLLGQLLLPWQMNIDPVLPVIKTWNLVWLDALGWSALLAVAIWNFRKRPWLSFALGWFVLQLFPLYVFLPRLDVANDRQLYLVGWAALLPVAVLCGRMMSLTGFRYSVAVLLLALTGLTLMRNEVYRSEVSLWEDTVRGSPNKARSYNNLGYAYYLAGDVTRAEQAYLTAIRLKSDYWRAENNLAQLRSNNGIISASEE